MKLSTISVLVQASHRLEGSRHIWQKGGVAGLVLQCVYYVKSVGFCYILYTHPPPTPPQMKIFDCFIFIVQEYGIFNYPVPQELQPCF